MRPLALGLVTAIAMTMASPALGCPIIRTCAAPQPIVAAVVVASADDLVDMANAASEDADLCDGWADMLSPPAWYGLGAFSWSGLASFPERVARALEQRHEAAEARSHAATYRTRVLLLRERAARLRAIASR
jgi:hypothetical protein